MAFRFRLMSQADAEAIARWHYPDPFSFYDWASRTRMTSPEFLDPTARGDDYVAVEGEADVAGGWFHFKLPHGHRIEIGLGLHPEIGDTGTRSRQRLPRGRARVRPPPVGAPKQFTSSSPASTAG